MNRLETVPNEFWIVVSQWDRDTRAIDPSNPPKGPLVHELYAGTEEQARNRAMALGDRYGWTTVVRVNPYLPAFLEESRQRSVNQCNESSPERK